MSYVNLPQRPKSSSPVLVAIIKREKDMEIVKKEHWYRIPLRYAPVGRADYLALYQGTNFGEEGGSINYYARIIRTEIVKRREILPEEEPHPRGEEDYYKLILGRIMKTPHRIYNETGRRLTFMFTTFEKLRKARDITDLYQENPVERRLWEGLKKRMINVSPQYCLFNEKGRLMYKLDFAIFCRKGKIDVECDGRAWHETPEDIERDERRDRYLKSSGWRVLRLPAKRIYQDLLGCLKTIEREVKILGGLR